MPTHKKRAPRGLALITTLMLLSLLMAMIGAFLLVNRAGNRFTMSSVERRQAQDVCTSAFAYAWFQLEQNRRWGTEDAPLTGVELYPVASPKLRLEFSQVGDEGRAIGHFSLNGNFEQPMGVFQMTVQNNLASRNFVPGVVPPRSAKVTILSEVGGVTRRLEALLRPVPHSHESASAGRNILLDDTSGLVRIESKDPYVNRIRAGGDLNLPSANDVQFLRHGVAASSGTLNVGGTDLAQADESTVKSYGEQSGGVYQPNVPAPVIHQFEIGDFAFPENSSSLPAGTWTFGDITHYQYRPQQIQYEYTIPNPDGPGSTTAIDAITRHQRRSSLYNVLTSPTGEQWAAGQAIIGSETDWDPPLPDDPLGSEGQAENWGYDGMGDGFEGGSTLPTSDVHQIRPGFKVNVTTAQFVIRSGFSMNTSGDFIVVGEGDRSPELYFGYDMTAGGVATQESLQDGLEAAQDNPQNYMGAIIAGGDVNVTGGVLGYGSMVAGGELTIKASSGLRTAPELGVVVKGQRIIVNPASEPEPALPGEPVNMDVPVFREAIVAESGGNWSNYNGWLDHDKPTRDSILDSLKDQSTGSTADVLWTALNSQIGGGGPTPDFASFGWPGGPVTVEQYVRLKEFYQTRASGYNDGDGDDSWLSLNSRESDAVGRVAGVLNNIAHRARSYQITVQDFLTNPEQPLPEMYMQGLVYADEDIIINTDGKSVRLEGAVIASNGNLIVNGASSVELVYDRGLLDDLYGGSLGDSVPLEQIFFLLE